MGVLRAACNCMHLYLSHTHTLIQSFVHSKQSLDSQNSALCKFAIEISRVEFLFLKFVNIDNTAYRFDSFSSICLTRFSSTLCLHWSFVSKFVITLLFIVALVLCNNWNMSSSCPIPVWCRMNNYCLCNWNWRRGEWILKFWFRSSCDVNWKMRAFFIPGCVTVIWIWTRLGHIISWWRFLSIPCQYHHSHVLLFKIPAGERWTRKEEKMKSLQWKHRIAWQGLTASVFFRFLPPTARIRAAYFWIERFPLDSVEWCRFCNNCGVLKSTNRSFVCTPCPWLKY